MVLVTVRCFGGPVTVRKTEGAGPDHSTLLRLQIKFKSVDQRQFTQPVGGIASDQACVLSLSFGGQTGTAAAYGRCMGVDGQQTH